MQGQALVDYVKRVMDLEKDVYTNQQIQNRFDKSFARRKPLLPPKPELKRMVKPIPPTNLKAENISVGKNIALIVVLLFLGIAFFADGATRPVYSDLAPLEMTIGTMMGIAAIGIFIRFAIVDDKNEKIERENKKAMALYQSELTKYNATIGQITEENEEKQKQYDLTLTVYSQKTAQYERERKDIYAQVSTSGQELQLALSSLYDMDVIYPKYRNLVAVSTIYEYLSSGRCDRLDGPDGAYNLYEMELRQNIVIGQLSSIIENLNQIKNNQFVLYNELVSANQKVTSVLADIGNNVKISAYQNEAAAKNAEALKYISLIKR